jgi:hypothetical protein
MAADTAAIPHAASVVHESHAVAAEHETLLNALSAVEAQIGAASDALEPLARSAPSDALLQAIASLDAAHRELLKVRSCQSQ